MLSFLKVFVRGIVCTILLPVILLVWVLYGVYCLVAFLVMLVKSIILFFAGDNAAGELPEDIEAKRILLEAEQAKVEEAQAMTMMYQGMAAMMQQNGMQPGMAPTQPQAEPAPQPATFDPFIPDPVEEKPLPGQEPSLEDQPENEEGGTSDDQSY